MKRLLSLVLLAMVVFSVMPVVPATSVGTGIGVDIVTEDFEPRVWACEDRVVYDDNTEPGRVFPDGDSDTELLERLNNYAFEGESIEWDVVVFDKNGIEKIEDVFATVGPVQGAGNDIEVNCEFIEERTRADESCNARIGEEEIGTRGNPFPENTAGLYTCRLTVETADSMYGEYWVTVEAVDLDGESGTMDENEYWFLNPVIAISVDGGLVFDEVLPDSSAYSETLLVGNDADDGSGVVLDMFISGTDFYDSASSGAKCPTTNKLSLENFRYFVTNGAYSSRDDIGTDVVDADRDTDAEGYTNIEYGIGFNDPHPFYDNAEILQAGPTLPGGYYRGNTLTPGSEMALTFRLDLPAPCNGDFDTGDIFFWGEAI